MSGSAYEDYSADESVLRTTKTDYSRRLNKDVIACVYSGMTVEEDFEEYMRKYREFAMAKDEEFFLKNGGKISTQEQADQYYQMHGYAEGEYRNDLEPISSSEFVKCMKDNPVMGFPSLFHYTEYIKKEKVAKNPSYRMKYQAISMRMNTLRNPIFLQLGSIENPLLAIWGVGSIQNKEGQYGIQVCIPRTVTIRTAEGVVKKVPSPDRLAVEAIQEAYDLALTLNDKFVEAGSKWSYFPSSGRPVRDSQAGTKMGNVIKYPSPDKANVYGPTMTLKFVPEHYQKYFAEVTQVEMSSGIVTEKIKPGVHFYIPSDRAGEKRPKLVHERVIPMPFVLCDRGEELKGKKAYETFMEILNPRNIIGQQKRSGERRPSTPLKPLLVIATVRISGIRAPLGEYVTPDMELVQLTLVDKNPTIGRSSQRKSYAVKDASGAPVNWKSALEETKRQKEIDVSEISGMEEDVDAASDEEDA